MVCGVLGSLCLWDCLILQQGAKILLNCRPNGKPLKWQLDDARAGHQGPTRDGWWWWWWCLCILTEQLVEIATRILINLIDFLKLRVHVVRQRRQNTWKSDLFCQLVTEVTVRGFRIALGIIWLIILAFFEVTRKISKFTCEEIWLSVPIITLNTTWFVTRLRMSWTTLLWFSE